MTGSFLFCFKGNNIYIFNPSFQKEDPMLHPSATSIQTLNMKPLSEATTEPPLTMNLSGPQLLSFLTSPLKTDLPVMSVAVERAVKEVTRVAERASSAVERDGIVFQTISSRQKNPYEDRNRVRSAGLK